MKKTITAICLLLLQGCVNQMDKDLGIEFNSTCLGRYQMDLIDTLKIANVMYANEHISFYLRDKVSESLTFNGKDRYINWANSIRTEKRRKYRELDLGGGVKGIESETFFHDKFRSGNKKYLMDGYLLKDFPLVEKSVYSTIVLSGNDGSFLVDDQRYREKFHRFFENAKADMNLLRSMSWPHNQLGVCLTPEFTLNVPRAGGETHYRTVWWNENNDRFQMTARVMESREQLSKKRGMAQKLFGLFASKNLDLAGRDGQLFLSDARYATDGLEFRWVTTDAKVGSTARPYIELEGTVDMANYPKLREVGMDARDIIVIMLKTFQVRENGLVGTS